MGAAAVAAARAAGYVSAGTVEFLLDRDGQFYFLEMNTRLQVEHPITELDTGVDLVVQMLRIAGGRRLRISQDDIELRGHAIECRINAEDPFNQFMPSTGRVSALLEPTGPGVRVDSCLYEGAEVSLYYDPLLAKLVVWGENRAHAIQRTRRALTEYRIAGIKTTIPLHQQILETTQFIAGQYHTRYLEESFDMPRGGEGDHAAVAAIVAAMLAHQRRSDVINRLAPAGGPSPWKLYGRRASMRSRAL
jgi:acetyl/propionyl-CoA carboxylase alpha subunit